jgi:hypothetical protein
VGNYNGFWALISSMTMPISKYGSVKLPYRNFTPLPNTNNISTGVTPKAKPHLVRLIDSSKRLDYYYMLQSIPDQI